MTTRDRSQIFPTVGPGLLSTLCGPISESLRPLRLNVCAPKPSDTNAEDTWTQSAQRFDGKVNRYSTA